MNAQAKTPITAYVPAWAAPLYSKGYTINAAARAVGCNTAHLRRALQGERNLSPALTEKLNNLPQKQLCLLAG